MAEILNELKRPYQCQVEVGKQYFPTRCKSNLYCSYQKENETDDEITDCEFEYECNWKIPSSNYPLYILDFAVEIGNTKIAIECDGFNFHHAYKYQEYKDTTRDKWLRNNGWIVIRFDGTTLYRHRGQIKKDLIALFNKYKPQQVKLI